MNLLIVNDIVIEANTMASDIPWETCGITNVFTAYNANGARTIIEENTIDILLCDIEMPDENGLSLIRWIQEKQYDIECILLTCHADFAYAQEGISLGCQDYITLPARYEDIAASVQKVCLRHQKHQEEHRFIFIILLAVVLVRQQLKRPGISLLLHQMNIIFFINSVKPGMNF